MVVVETERRAGAEGILDSPQKEASDVGFLNFPIVILDQQQAMTQSLSLMGAL